jgi:hypothetical protein
MLTRKEAQALLDKLCAEQGFCLPASEETRIIEDPPADVGAFTDEVFRAEGLDPAAAERRLYRGVRDVVATAFARAEANGKAS